MIEIYTSQVVFRAYDLKFCEPKRLPSEGKLLDFGIVYDTQVQQFKNSKDHTLEGNPKVVIC